MLAVQQVGTSHYLLNTEDPGWRVKLSWPQYQTFTDWSEHRLSSVGLWQRLDYYKRMAEQVTCPLCKQGTLPRDAIHYLLMADPQDTHSLHDALIHGQEAGR